jgi:hypothetical protein
MNTDQPIVDDPTLETYNLDERVATFKDWLDQSSFPLHQSQAGHLFVVMGDDFRYGNAQAIL